MPEYLEITVDKFIFRVMADRLYTKDGIWAEAIDSGKRIRVGLSDYFQQRIGDATFIHFKSLGTKLAAGDAFAELETIKANSDLYSPVGGVLSEFNQSLVLYTEHINQDPYGNGWVAVIDAADWPKDQVKLLKPQEYVSAIQAQAEEELNDA